MTNLVPASGNRAAVMTDLGVIELQDRPMPVAREGHAVVRIEAVGVCGSDAAYFTYGRIGGWFVDGPLVLGHETAGTVADVGAGVENVGVGDRVAIEPGTPCRNCDQCLAGRYHLCPDLVFLATPPHDGALVQYLAIDARNLFRIPDSMTFEEAALLEPLSVGIWACRRAGLAPGDDVLVTGAGPVGLLAAATARALGAGSVTVVDPSAFRRGFAADMGFDVEEPSSTDGPAFDVLIECSGAKGVLAAGLDRLRSAGRAAMVGMSKEDDIPLPLPRLNARELTIALVNRYSHTWPTAIDLVRTGRVDVAPLVTHRFDLDQAAEALLVATSTPESMKAVIRPHG